MKAVFVGGGALRLLGVLRGALAQKGLFEGGEICLHDLNISRAEAMARMVMKTPEYAKCRCRITWDASLDRALVGADAVGVILMAGSQLSYKMGDLASKQHDFLSSDNVSPNGAFLGIKGGPILMNIARKMEQHCPNAWLLDFANPIAVLSGMVNNHTRIKSLGLCGGYTNHQWDLSRLLGKDEYNGFDVDVAGINHLSFITRGRLKNRDLFKLLDASFGRNWKAPKLQKWWPERTRHNIHNAVLSLKRFYEELGVLIFSTEGDGMAHLRYDEELARQRKDPLPTPASVRKFIKHDVVRRKQMDAAFQAHLNADLDQKFWDNHWKTDMTFMRTDEDIFVRILKGIGGAEPVELASSRPNRGAIAGIPDRNVVEYSQVLHRGKLKPKGRLAVPGVVQGLTMSLSAHQTMLGDAIVTEDSKLLAQALMAYPIRPYSRQARLLYKELLRINRDEIPRALYAAVDYL